jgi:hypothetical protein
MEPLIAIYDACVLYSAFRRDFLVRLAIHGRRAGVFRAKWTGRIHREWIRAILRNNPSVTLAKLLRTRRLMDEYVRGCRVHGYQRWEPRLNKLPDENDRHVLAAALACVANVIVTLNLRHFPQDVLSPFGVQALEPDACVALVNNNGIVIAAAAKHRAALKHPPLSTEDYLDSLRRNELPNTAEFLKGHSI